MICEAVLFMNSNLRTFARHADAHCDTVNVLLVWGSYDVRQDGNVW